MAFAGALELVCSLEGEFEETRLTGGGGKLFFFAANADGTGGATDGGTAVLFAVPCRIDMYMFLHSGDNMR